jgi:cytosine/adenosine deaminase-related metal-dependent hydrolase
MIALRARYVFPVAGLPIRDGIVAFEGDRILAVEEQSSPSVRDFAEAAEDLGNVAILPGLVNSHTHLEFSDLREPLGTRGMTFPDWIRLVVQHRRGRASTWTFLRRITVGLDESSLFGATAIGDVTSQWWDVNSQKGVGITQFLEQIGLRRGSLVGELPRLLAVNESTATVHNGLSPHAPYTVHPELMGMCARLSAHHKFPLAHHLAESREELQLLRSGDGPFVKLLQDLGAWDPDAIPRGSSPLDYLKMLAEAHRALIIHGNYLDEEEIGFIALNRNRMSVVYCPRTHDYFQHDPYPLAKMLAAGINVAIGTDSRASSPDLSPLAEMRFAAKKHPLVSPPTLLKMITSNAARALGRDQEIGTIESGKFADFAIIKLPGHDAADPHELLLDPSCSVRGTIFRGQQVPMTPWPKTTQ